MHPARHPDHPPALDGSPEGRPPASRRALTERELDVLRFLPTRLSTGEIGALLRISPNTVKTHLKNIYRKLGARSRNEAIVLAVAQQLIAASSADLVSPRI